MKYFLAIGVVGIAAAGFAAKGLDKPVFASSTHPAIQYADAAHHDRAQKLADDLENGKVKLQASKDGTGYLASLLKSLGVNADSQMLVFSKTSFQASRINPR